MQDDKEFQQVIEERLAKLPKVVQDAIRGGDVTAHLRKLAETHKLHVDQWESLEKEVQFTMLGFEPTEELEQNIKNHVGVTSEIAHALTSDIAEMVFEPIREALERELEHPSAKAEEVSAMESSRKENIAKETAAESGGGSAVVAPTKAASPVLPATPPAAPPTGTAKRAPIAPTYLSSTPSHERPTIEGDPYREQTA